MGKGRTAEGRKPAHDSGKIRQRRAIRQKDGGDSQTQLCGGAISSVSRRPAGLREFFSGKMPFRAGDRGHWRAPRFGMTPHRNGPPGRRLFAVRRTKMGGVSAPRRLSKKGFALFDKRIAVCCAHVLSAVSGQDAHLQPELYFLSGTGGELPRRGKRDHPGVRPDRK